MGEHKADERSTPQYDDGKRKVQGELTPFEIDFIGEFQEDIPLIPEPFTPMAERLGISLEELFEQKKRFQERGQMRRFSAVLHHRQVGFSANAMGVWKVDEKIVDEVGVKMASFRAVSHCYRRPIYPDWPYSIFTMVHARDKATCDQLLESIAKETGVKEYTSLYSTKEYKKVRVRYFTPEMEVWEENATASSPR